MNDGILPELRARTAAAHARLETNVQIERRVSDLAGYTELVEKFLGWYEPMERRLAGLEGWAASGLGPGRLDKAAWLTHDLTVLGRTAETIAALPRCPSLPEVTSLARAFGCAYVMEGATLGGRHISGLLRESRVHEEARTFFRSYGAAVGERWKQFIAALEAFAAREPAREEILEAACETFSSIEDWVCGAPGASSEHASVR